MQSHKGALGSESWTRVHCVKMYSAIKWVKSDRIAFYIGTIHIYTFREKYKIGM